MDSLNQLKIQLPLDMQDKFDPSKLVCQQKPSHLQLCKECANVKNKISIDLSQDEKYCSGCKSVKDKNNFSSNQDSCKACKSNLMKKYYEKNINHHRVTV